MLFLIVLAEADRLMNLRRILTGAGGGRVTLDRVENA
jgi:hypothetical protein